MHTNEIAHVHYVGPGVLKKMQELDDTPSTCEKYPFEGEQQGEVSLAWGKSGRMYVYLSSLDRTEVYETMDMTMAGGDL